MKKILPFLAIAVLLTMVSSCRKERNQAATVIRNCTGTYLRVDGKDYHVCNLEKAASFGDNTAVTVTFKKIKSCNGSAQNEIVCMMAHPNEGWIEIDRIK
ncbi:MAG TPA: hypothetical protein VF868_09115 [Bacteroidia bacterium]